MKGDGVSSISKGFILAGCPSVLTSLWSVDDCSTSNLMIDVYGSLKKKYTISEALRNAKLSYLQKADVEKAHPYYWAPFLLSGQDKAVVVSNDTNYLFWGLGCILFGVSAFLFSRFYSGKS